MSQIIAPTRSIISWYQAPRSPPATALTVLAVLRSEQHFAMALHHGLAVLVWTLACWLAIVAGQPQHSITRFDNLPARLFFFDDTPVRAPRGTT